MIADRDLTRVLNGALEILPFYVPAKKSQGKQKVNLYNTMPQLISMAGWPGGRFTDASRSKGAILSPFARRNIVRLLPTGRNSVRARTGHNFSNKATNKWAGLLWMRLYLRSVQRLEMGSSVSQDLGLRKSLRFNHPLRHARREYFVPKLRVYLNVSQAKQFESISIRWCCTNYFLFGSVARYGPQSVASGTSYPWRLQESPVLEGQIKIHQKLDHCTCVT